MKMITFDDIEIVFLIFVGVRAAANRDEGGAGSRKGAIWVPYMAAELDDIEAWSG